MIASEFKAIREKLGMSKAELARALRVNGTRTIHRWETGAAKVPGPVSIVMEFFSAYSPWTEEENRQKIGNSL